MTSADICSFPILLTPLHVMLLPPNPDEIVVLVSHLTSLQCAGQPLREITYNETQHDY